MLKILIADDEPHFRKYIEGIFDWGSLGLEICASCKNGEEALQLAQEILPDIALLDINMPGMNGLALTEELKKEASDLLIVFITGYSEFEYARKALQLGVDEYILKPFTKEELLNVILKLKLKIDKRMADRRIEHADKKLLREELLNKIVTEHIPEQLELLEEKLDRVSIHFSYEQFVVCVIEIDHIKELCTQRNEIDLWRFGIANIVQELLEGVGIVNHTFYGSENRIVLITNYNKKQGHSSQIINICNEVKENINQYFGFTVTIGIGNEVSTLPDTAISYTQALVAIQEKFISGPNCVFCFNNVLAQNREASFYRLGLNDILLENLRKGDMISIGKILDQEKEYILSNQLSIDYAYMMISGMLSICLSYITEMNGNIHRILGNRFSPYQELYSRQSLDACFELLVEIFHKTIQELGESRSRRAADILDQVETYIREHYADITLKIDDIAAGVYLDASYIRRIFAKHMGCTITDYITTVRMKEAQRLMQTEALTIAEISESVGYSESGYFSKCFKKQYGVSPKVFMNQLVK